MGVTIRKLMRLPSLQDAEIVAGLDGIDQVVSSVSVLEVDSRLMESQKFGSRYHFGSELLITSMYAAKDDVVHQIEIVKRAYEEGEVGLILYYLGYILSDLDQRLIELCDKLRFPLIVMPKDNLGLRYSDVITEVMEMILRDRDEHTYFATEVIERLSHLDSSHRSVNAVLAAIRERTHVSIFLFDEADRLLNYAEWPMNRNLPIYEILDEYQNAELRHEIVEVSAAGSRFFILKTQEYIDAAPITMVFVKEQKLLTEDICRQIIYILKTYLNLWTENYGRLNTKQLVSAIINNEPEKMHRISEKLNINAKSLSCAYFIYIQKDKDHEYDKIKQIRSVARAFLENYKNMFLSDIFDETMIIFADRHREVPGEDTKLLLEELDKMGISCIAASFERLDSTAEVKTVYWQFQECKTYIPVIFPNKRVISGGEIDFVHEVKNAFETEKENRYFDTLSAELKKSERNSEELITTMETFLLDGDRSISKTAKILYLHENTIKYRIRLLESAAGHKLTRMPEVYQLYFGAALQRLKEHI